MSLHRLWNPVTHPDAVTVQGMYRPMLRRFEWLMQGLIERDELAGGERKMLSYALMAMRREAR